MSQTWKTSNQQYGTHYGRSSSQPRSKIGRSTLQYLQSLDQGNFIHEQEKIAQRERHGLFTQPLGFSPGDAYQDPKGDFLNNLVIKPSKRMQVNQRLQQKVGPQLFSKFGSTNINDPYKDPFRAKQLYLKQKTDMNIHSKAFNAGGKQKLVKHSEFEHNKQYNDKVFNTRDDNGNVTIAKKGIFTNNMKKGFGNTTSGHLFSQYPYQGYPEEDQRNKNSNDRLLHKAKIPTPFKGSSHPNQSFTPNYTVYNTSQPYQPKNEDEQFRGRQTSGGNWKYNNPGKKGHNGTFTAFPQYIQNGEKVKLPRKEQNIWIPNFNGTSKGLGQTLSKPCPAPSQLILNQIRQYS